MVGGVRSLFDCFQLLLRSIRFLVSEVDLFAVEISQTLFLRLMSLLNSVLFLCSAIGTDITVCLSQLSGSWVH